MRQKIIGIMGPGRGASDQEWRVANEMGFLIAQHGYILLTGGVAHGVMDGANKGAAKANGFKIGILPYKEPSDTHPASEFLDVVISTHFGEGRNVINALSSDFLVVIGMCPGTATEACHAIKNHRPVVLLENRLETFHFLHDVLGGGVTMLNSPSDAIAEINRFFQK